MSLCRVCNSKNSQWRAAMVRLFEKMLKKGLFFASRWCKPTSIRIVVHVVSRECEWEKRDSRGYRDWFELATRRANQSRRMHSAHMLLMCARWHGDHQPTSRGEHQGIRVRASVLRIITRHISCALSLSLARVCDLYIIGRKARRDQEKNERKRRRQL